MEKIIYKGCKRNNPFNVRFLCKNRWLGQSLPNNGFCVFGSVEYGLRAGIILLRNYITIYKLRTVSSIIHRFAPPAENNTSAYVSYVTKQFDSYGLNPLCISISDDSFFLLCKCICWYESQYKLVKSEFDYIVKKYSIYGR